MRPIQQQTQSAAKVSQGSNNGKQLHFFQGKSVPKAGSVKIILIIFRDDTKYIFLLEFSRIHVHVMRLYAVIAANSTICWSAQKEFSVWCILQAGKITS